MCACRFLLLCLSLLAAFSNGILAQTPPARPITNADVLQMLKAGITEETIIHKIDTSDTAFKLDPDDLIVLKAAGIPEILLQAMIKRQAAIRSQPAATPAVPANPPVAGATATTTGTAIAANSRQLYYTELVPLPDGVRYIFVLLDQLTAENKNVGDTAWFELLKPLASESEESLLRGTRMKAVVTAAKKPGRGLKYGALVWRCAALVLPNGYEVPAPAISFPTGKLEFWSFKKEQVVKHPEDRLDVRKVKEAMQWGAGATAIAALATQSEILSYAAGGLLIAEFLMKNPDVGWLSGTGFVFQFKGLRVPAANQPPMALADMPPEQARSRGEQLLRTVLKTAGGEALRNLKDSIIEELSVTDDQGARVTRKDRWFTVYPNMFRFEREEQIPGGPVKRITQLTDGKSTWYKEDRKSFTRVKDAGKKLSWLDLLHYAAEGKIHGTYSGRRSSGSGELELITVSSPLPGLLGDFVLAIDPTSGLVYEWASKGGPLLARFSDYRKAGGLFIPFKAELGVIATSTTTSVTTNSGLAPKLFKPK